MGSHQPLILLLRDIEERSRQKAHALPQQLEARRTWDGVGFRLGSFQMVAQLSEVKEILTQPRMSRVPGAKPWIKGVANIRGNLLTIIDLKGFLVGEIMKVTKRSRVLVVNHQGLTAGLIVDEVLGLRHFENDEQSQETIYLGQQWTELITGAYRQDETTWTVLGLNALVAHEAFLDVSL